MVELFVPMKKLVTKESMISLMNKSQEMKVKVIGRALVALLSRQDADERQAAQTHLHNGIGFTPSDAYSGTITAKYFLKHGTLLEWQVQKWENPTATGIPRIAKYSRQLNEIANEKLASK